MKVEKLFQVLVVAGASSTVGLGLGGCGDDDETPPAGTGGTSGTGGSKASGGASSSGGATSSGGAASSGGSKATGGAASGGAVSSGGASSGGASASGGASSGGSNNPPDAGSCDEKCGPNAANEDWTDCGGCCCWLAPGASGAGPTDGCPAEELCCIGRGRD